MLALTALWYFSVGLYVRYEAGSARLLWTVPCYCLPFILPVLAVILMISYRRSNRSTSPWIIYPALWAGVSPWLIFLAFTLPA